MPAAGTGRWLYDAERPMSSTTSVFPPDLPRAAALPTGPAPLAWLLAMLATGMVALPFWWAWLEAPISNFWPLMVSWACGAVLVAMAWAVRSRVQGLRMRAAQVLAAGLLLAAVVSAGIGLLQYFVGDPGLAPWVYPSLPGQAIGNLRQRNQQATLIGLGLWALLWWAARMRLGQRGARSLAERWLALPFAWTVLWLALAAAATTSRTGALQWAMLVLLVGVWWGRRRPQVVGMAVAALVLMLLAAWALPHALRLFSGVEAPGLFGRMLGDEQACVSRTVLWANMLELIAQRPWTGWGWGGLSYAHYMADFDGTRFCVLLDNAHNLPLHLAVELGVPLALLWCGVALWWVLRARPWAESDPVRQLAWGVLALVGLHSMLEFPLWYGPFQIVTLAALALLWRRPAWWPAWASWQRVPLLLSAFAAAWVYTAWDYHRVSQLYRPVHLRAPDYREQTFEKVSNSVLFPHQVDFAMLTVSRLTPETAGASLVLARGLLHFSPEPRVIEILIQSAEWAGQLEEAALHRRKYQRAYPEDYARWQSRMAGSASAEGASPARAGSAP